MKSLLIILFFPIIAVGQTLKYYVPMEYTGACVFVQHPDTMYCLGGVGHIMTPNPLPSSAQLGLLGGLFNSLIATDQSGNLYTSGDFNCTNGCLTDWTSYPTDSTGTAISANPITAFATFGATWAAIRSDSTLWYAGNDNIGIFTGPGTANYKMFKISSNHYTRLAISYYGLLGLRSNGSIDIWVTGGGGTPTNKTSSIGTNKFIGIAAGGTNSFSYSFWAIAQMTAGSQYGHPMVMGNNCVMWGKPNGSQSFSNFSDLYTQLGLTSNIKQIDQDEAAMHMIDSTGVMYTSGYEDQGELGNDTEYVNRYTNPNFPLLGWGFVYNYASTGVQQVGSGVHWDSLYSTNFFGFYKVAQGKPAGATVDSVYSWGRGKSWVLGNGYGLTLGSDSTQASTNPNYYDFLVPTQEHIWSGLNISINMTLTTLNAGTNANINTSSTTLTAVGHPFYLVNAANSADTIGRHWVSTTWTCTSKPSGAPNPTFSTPNSMSTPVSGLQNGSYTFQIFTVDDNNGTNAASVTLNVSINPPIVIPKGFKVKVN